MNDLGALAHPSVEKYARHVNPAFIKLLGIFGYGRAFVRAKDVWVWDHKDIRYLDALSCYGAANLGHNHPRMLARLKKFLDEDAFNFVHIGPSIYQGELAAQLAELCGPGLDVAIFSNTGAEAVEGALKMARAATGRKGILYCKGGYHGTSLGTLSIMGEKPMRLPFEPLLGECHEIAFGDLGALKKALSGRKFAAFVADPGLCEAGLLVPPQGYLAEAQELCKQYGTLFILDEVQTGMGRTGTLFAYQQEQMVPDILCLAKSLSGGIAPIGATLSRLDIHQKAFGSLDRFNLHFTTFGGNAFSCAAAGEALRILGDEQLVQNGQRMGLKLLSDLKYRLNGHPLVKDIRGRGLFIAIELGPTEKGLLNRLLPGLVESVARSMFGQWASVKLLERQLICQPATQHWNVLKVMPPLTLKETEANTIVNTICEVLNDYQDVASILKEVSGRVGKQFMAGWAF